MSLRASAAAEPQPADSRRYAGLEHLTQAAAGCRLVLAEAV